MNITEANATSTVLHAIADLPHGAAKQLPEKVFRDAYFLAVRADKTLQAGNLPQLVIDARVAAE